MIHSIELLRYQQADPKTRGEPPKPLPMPWDAPTRSSLTLAEIEHRLLALRRERA